MEETLGDWMIEWEQKERVRHRIACPEQKYPVAEALYPTIQDWEKANNDDWYGYIARTV